MFSDEISSGISGREWFIDDMGTLFVLTIFTPFYSFPGPKSDPFFYTSESFRKKWGENNNEEDKDLDIDKSIHKGQEALLMNFTNYKPVIKDEQSILNINDASISVRDSLDTRRFTSSQFR